MGYDNFGLKIGIEGEREFKNSIREINSSFKILKSEMNLVTSSFKGNASSMEALSSKSSVLKREIESQKEKIAVLKVLLIMPRRHLAKMINGHKLGHLNSIMPRRN